MSHFHCLARTSLRTSCSRFAGRRSACISRSSEPLWSASTHQSSSSSSSFVFKVALAAMPSLALAGLGLQGSVQCSTESPTQQRVGSLKVLFCGKTEKFSPIYEKQPAAATASMNAGDHNLSVGRGSINAAFAKLLGVKPTLNPYKELHTIMSEVARLEPNSMQDMTNVAAEQGEKAAALAKEVGLMGCFARSPIDVLGGHDQTGIAILDVFDAASRPLHEKNVAMLYVVGPKGLHGKKSNEVVLPGYTFKTRTTGQIIADADVFLTAIEKSSENALRLVCEYNEKVSKLAGSTELPQVKVVQFCLVGGGVYRHQECTKVDVAKAIVRGLKHAADSSSEKVLPTVRFAYDDVAFESAVLMASGVR